MKKWEYCRIVIDDEGWCVVSRGNMPDEMAANFFELLNKLGREGWELIVFYPLYAFTLPNLPNKIDETKVFILKREVNNG